MKQLTVYFSLIVCILLQISCGKDSKEVVVPTPKPEEPKPPVEQPVVWSSDRAKNLTIVYFVPSDLDTIKGYEKRLSELMLWSQDWVKKEMNRNGYGEKTFGLIKDQTGKKVKIVTIRGKQSTAGYPSSVDGASAITTEINQHFSSKPTDKASEHILVILPRYRTNPIGGGPFFGWGRWCFALDYESLDIRLLGTDTNEFTKWFGGLVHELGHGLNLPHNRQKKSEDASLGMALMWAGNYTLAKSKTFLTKADCAVLNVNQIFNNDNKTYYGNVTAALDRIYAEYNAAKDALIVKGKFTSNTKVTDVLYFNDPNVNNEGVGVNKDYNAIAWTSKPLANDSFYVEIPLNELVEKGNTPYELKVKLVCENGTVKEFLYDYAFVNGIPNLALPYAAPGWAIAEFSSQETQNEEGAAINAIDGNPNTYWHSRWSTNSTTYPHSLTIDTKKTSSYSGFTISHRKGLQRAFKDFEIWVKGDTGDFVKLGNYITENKEGKQQFSFSTNQNFRYIKIVALNAFDGMQFASLGEFGLY